MATSGADLQGGEGRRGGGGSASFPTPPHTKAAAPTASLGARQWARGTPLACSTEGSRDAAQSREGGYTALTPQQSYFNTNRSELSAGTRH